MRSKSYLDKTTNLSKLIIQLREKITLKYHFIAKATSTILKLKKKKQQTNSISPNPRTDLFIHKINYDNEIKRLKMQTAVPYFGSTITMTIFRSF